MTLSRRSFVRQAALGSLALALPERVDALSPVGPQALSIPRRPVRIRGRVRDGARGVPAAVLSDGRVTTATDVDGRFELASDASAGWLSLSLPSGYRIPVSETGTARLHRPIQGTGAEMEAVFDLEPWPDTDRHAFLALADPQTQTPWEMARLHDETVPSVRRTLDELGKPAFGVTCGDIMYDDLSLYPDYERAVRDMGSPFFQVVGNHDLDQVARTDEGSTATFQERFGPARYSFNVGDVHYVVLDDVLWHGAGYIGYVHGEALEWLAGDLAHIDAGRPVVLFVHIPVLGTQHLRRGAERPGISVSVTNRDALYRLLEPYQAHVVSGHTHETEHHRHGGLHEHVCGAVCGAWWSGDICHDGAPNGYAVFEARGEELRWRYQATGRSPDHQLRVYPAGSDPRAPDEIVANVWFADPEWTVTWYEDGVRRGAMARRVGQDPLTVALHTGPERPEHRPWVEPMPTGHMYYAPIGRDHGDLLVEARDPYGGVFTARPEPVPPAG